MKDELTRRLLDEGASVVGLAEVGEVLHADIAHLGRAVSIGVAAGMRDGTLHLLVHIQKQAARFLKSRGFRYFSIPPDSDRRTDSFSSRLYPLMTHKIAATSAGIGWIGKNGLLISPRFGPRLSLATVLTDAPLDMDHPISESRCGECSLCVDHCPADAISGREWSRQAPFPRQVSREACSAHKRRLRPVPNKPNCGLCISICPYGRQDNMRVETAAHSED